MNFFDSRKQTIGMHIGFPKPLPPSIVPEVLSGPNWMGAFLVRHIIKSALLRGDLLPGGDMGGIGELSDCVLIANVSNADAAVETVKTELNQVAGLGAYQIAILEVAGWRSVHPSRGARVDWLFSTERHEAAHEEFKAAGREFVRNLETVLNQWRERQATAGEAERRELDAAIIGVEAILPTLRASMLPGTIEPGEDAS